MLIFAAVRFHSVFLVWIDVFFVVDLSEISQEGITFLDADNLSDFRVRVDASCGGLAFAILRTGINHRYF